MNYQESFLTEFFEFLNKNTEYAVLRNFEGLPAHNNSRDIDIAIEKHNYKRIRKGLLELIEQQNWYILTYLYSDRLVTWVCGHLGGDNTTDVIQLDFFYNTSVYGIELLPAHEILNRRKFSGMLYHACKEDEFLDKYLYDRAVGEQYPEKYQKTRDAVMTSDVVKQKIRNVFGVNSIESCDKGNSRKMLLHALFRQILKRPFYGIFPICVFLLYRIRNYLRSDTGFCIGFTGPDGVGKTTVIELFIRQLGDVFSKAHAYCHFRPMLFGNLGDVAHSAGLKKDVDHNYDMPHRGRKTGVLSSLFRLCYYSVDYILGYAIKVKTLTRMTYVVIFDRYYTDIICDSHRTRVWLSYKFLYWFGRIFIPSLDYNILLTADTDTILERKRELSTNAVKEIKKRIDYLANKPNFYKVNNNGRPVDAVQEILSMVFERQHERNKGKVYYEKGNALD